MNPELPEDVVKQVNAFLDAAPPADEERNELVVLAKILREDGLTALAMRQIQREIQPSELADYLLDVVRNDSWFLRMAPVLEPIERFRKVTQDTTLEIATVLRSGGFGGPMLSVGSDWQGYHDAVINSPVPLHWFLVFFPDRGRGAVPVVFQDDELRFCTKRVVGELRVHLATDHGGTLVAFVGPERFVASVEHQDLLHVLSEQPGMFVQMELRIE